MGFFNTLGRYRKEPRLGHFLFDDVRRFENGPECSRHGRGLQPVQAAPWSTTRSLS